MGAHALCYTCSVFCSECLMNGRSVSFIEDKREMNAFYGGTQRNVGLFILGDLGWLSLFFYGSMLYILNIPHSKPLSSNTMTYRFCTRDIKNLYLYLKHANNKIAFPLQDDWSIIWSVTRFPPSKIWVKLTSCHICIVISSVLEKIKTFLQEFYRDSDDGTKHFTYAEQLVRMQYD